ncbi:fumarate hydratase, partial [Salmonella enterica subsp. enterica serovar Typhimurium]|nr:fumarate hydratase [Salmonella enterica subsp. enterica serovar Typhimurium]
MSRILNTEIIIPIIEKLVKKACYELDDNLMCSFRKAYDKEESKIGKETIKILID